MAHDRQRGLVMEGINGRQGRIIQRWGEGATLEAIGREEGITRERVRQILKRVGLTGLNRQKMIAKVYPSLKCSSTTRVRWAKKLGVPRYGMGYDYRVLKGILDQHPHLCPVCGDEVSQLYKRYCSAECRTFRNNAYQRVAKQRRYAGDASFREKQKQYQRSPQSKAYHQEYNRRPEVKDRRRAMYYLRKEQDNQQESKAPRPTGLKEGATW